MTRLSLVLPAYDEADRLPRALAAYLGWLPADAELVIVDDGSTDGTREITDGAAARDTRVRVLRSDHNHGKGYAVRVGILAAAGELIVFTDADGSYGPEQLERVVAALDRAPVAIGARLGSQAGTGSPLLRRLASPAFNRVMRLLLGLPFHDTQCGLKGFRRDAAEAVFGRARVDGFAFDAEALLVAQRLAIEVVEVPVTAEDRQGSKVRVGGDALRMLADVWKVRRAAARGVYDETPVRDSAG
ncbi:MAG TPA: dolichyl-phosphate beta-glucosyltransferase [Actinomycetota bacterium]|nr:dolichyl-phosphate beta-glucosyltransferase [Actinomycetota bacterium]